MFFMEKFHCTKENVELYNRQYYWATEGNCKMYRTKGLNSASY